ncbi:AraC family transcriptional regulator [Thiohalomonas denitrificans]|uniref:AraC family transcriptional regulator n=1 Tax=Thiohalomonas denitrificans TaxID=415747 RepID=UPI0026F0D854|nr:AraC family transcriptional regulator [Thiohalomonas denitrificans]
MNEQTTRAYRKRFERVFEYIERHLTENLSVDELSEVANFSRFHFQRQFSAYVGQSVTQYIQLMRLRHASYQLAFAHGRRVIDIALEAGFENPESFSRAFKRRFGQTPSEFRQQPAWQPWNERMHLPERNRRDPMHVNIVEFKELLVAALEHRGAPERIFDSVKVFIDWRKASGLSPNATSRTFGIVFSDPNTTPPETFRFDICGEVDAPVPDNPQGVTTKRIPAGRCAVVRHHGSLDQISESAYFLCGDWLPESGEELRDFPLFFHYLKRVPDVPEHEQITDVYLPLK